MLGARAGEVLELEIHYHLTEMDTLRGCRTLVSLCCCRCEGSRRSVRCLVSKFSSLRAWFQPTGLAGVAPASRTWLQATAVRCAPGCKQQRCDAGPTSGL
jgi:hypothetical protein